MSIVATPPVRRKLNRWVESITDAWLCATLAWETEREIVAIGYTTEMEDFERDHPKPRLRDFMVQMSHAGGDQEVVSRAVTTGGSDLTEGRP